MASSGVMTVHENSSLFGETPQPAELPVARSPWFVLAQASIFIAWSLITVFGLAAIADQWWPNKLSMKVMVAFAPVVLMGFLMIRLGVLVRIRAARTHGKLVLFVLTFFWMSAGFFLSRTRFSSSRFDLASNLLSAFLTGLIFAVFYNYIPKNRSARSGIIDTSDPGWEK